jgi:hypothetical protein
VRSRNVLITQSPVWDDTWGWSRLRGSSRLDRSGAVQLITMGVEAGRRLRPSMGVGACGEDATDPDSTPACQDWGTALARYVGTGEAPRSVAGRSEEPADETR